MNTFVGETGRSWQYDPLAQLGERGSFGAVYRGRGDDDSVVAVKVVDTHQTGDEALRRREVSILQRTNQADSEYLIKMLDVGMDETNRLLIVLELADGQLEIPRPGLSIKDACDALDQILRGLKDLHGISILHRDLKPANVLRVGSRLVLSDFGIARDSEIGTQTATYKGWGTQPYMAPELWEVPGSPTVKSDLYAVGVIAFELLTGDRPFTGDENELCEAHRQTPPPPLPELIPPILQSLVIRLLAKDPSKRPADARAALERLQKSRILVSSAARDLASSIAFLDRKAAIANAQDRALLQARARQWEFFGQARADMAEVLDDTISQLINVDDRFGLMPPRLEDPNNRTSRDWAGDKHRWTITGKYADLVIRLWEPEGDRPELAEVCGGELTTFSHSTRTTDLLANAIYASPSNRWSMYRQKPNSVSSRGVSDLRNGQGLNEESFWEHYLNVSGDEAWESNIGPLDENSLVALLGEIAMNQRQDRH